MQVRPMKQITIKMPKQFCRQTRNWFNKTDGYGCFYGEFAVQVFGVPRTYNEMCFFPVYGEYGMGSEFAHALLTAHSDTAWKSSRIRRAKFREVCEKYGVKVIG